MPQASVPGYGKPAGGTAGLSLPELRAGSQRRVLFLRGNSEYIRLYPDDQGDGPGDDAEPYGWTERVYPVQRYYLRGTERIGLCGGSL